MRRVLFILLLVLGGGALLAWGLGGLEPARAPVSAASGAVASPRPLLNGPRTFLQPEQMAQASAAGGFEQPPRSLLRVARAMEYGDFIWNEDGVPGGPVTVRVDLRSQLISVFRAGHEIGTAVVLYGADAKETPVGRFPILWKGRNHRSSLYDAPMPYTMRLTGDGVAIHGSDVRWGAATHGCIGVPTAFAAHLFDAAKVGDPVTIVRSSKPA